MEGRIEIQFGTIPPTLTLVRDGKVRALAVTRASRSPAIPDVPTIAESGVPGYEASLWQAVVAPAATPAPIIARLNREIVAALAAPDVKAALTPHGIELAPGTPEQLAARIRDDIAKWREVIQATGIRTQEEPYLNSSGRGSEMKPSRFGIQHLGRLCASSTVACR